MLVYQSKKGEFFSCIIDQTEWTESLLSFDKSFSKTVALDHWAIFSLDSHDFGYMFVQSSGEVKEYADYSGMVSPMMVGIKLFLDWVFPWSAVQKSKESEQEIQLLKDVIDQAYLRKDLQSLKKMSDFLQQAKAPLASRFIEDLWDPRTKDSKNKDSKNSGKQEIPTDSTNEIIFNI